MQSAPATNPLPVLVVDDDSALIRTLADILRLHGFAPETAQSGQEGLALAREHAPALALVDLRLPDMDGVELASRLHALSELTQVVVLTGNASVESAVAAMREQSMDYLVKPVQIDRLLQVITMAGERWQRRRAEERLRQSDERFRRVVESDMLGMMFFRMGGDIFDANEAFLRMTGFSRADLEAGNVNWKDLTPAEYDQLDARKATELERDGVVAPYEKEYIRKDGKRVSVLIGAAMLEGQNGGVSFVLDITEKKSAEQALAERARQQEAVAAFGQRALRDEDMQALFEEAVALVPGMVHAPVGVIVERRNDGATGVVRAAFGVSDPALVGSIVPLDDATVSGLTLQSREPVLVTDAEQDPRFQTSPVLRKYNVRSAVSVPIPGAMLPTGVLQVFDTSAREFSRDDVYFLTAIAHVLGMTAERQRAERAIRQSQRLEAVGRLASGVAHDFNNMLSAITGYTEMVMNDLPPDDAHRDDLKEILGAAGRAAGLTRQLLAFSREQVMRPRILNLNDVVIGMEKMIRRLIGQAAGGADIELALHLSPDVAWVKADPGQLEQVLMNLCVNARDAMPTGGRLTIETVNTTLDESRGHDHTLSPDAHGDYVMLAVSDTGHGMDADTRARIFEPFFTTKAPDKGTGLGLATVYGIVKQSAGELFVYSEPDLGSSFKIFLPHAHEMSEVVEGDEVESHPAGGSETVLVAEDESAIRTVIQRSLERAGYTVLMAANGDEALAILDKHSAPIHLLLTDMIMPGMNGSELAARARERRPGLRVMFLSGYTASTARNGHGIGADEHFLQKPFGTETLVATTREVLDARKSREIRVTPIRGQPVVRSDSP